ncbi:MAG: MFS transporter [Deltaproteobacteria bacterium]|nr:MFS transporter [Deltaproteobacteria bacterium]
MQTSARPRVFYGWYIVATGFLVQVACAFYLSSTLGVMLKAITAEMRVSRGTFSLMRSVELVAYAAVTPWIGSLLDRHGARRLMVIGSIISVAGFVLLGYARNFWEFAAVRVALVSIGHAFVCYFVVNVAISRWFIRRRGRALAIAHVGQGVSKTTIALAVAYLMTVIGWRSVWVLFGGLVVVLALIPAALWMRRSPEDMGLRPDGDPDYAAAPDRGASRPPGPAPEDVTWTRREALHTPTFWLITFIFSTVDIGIAGFNLHVLAYISDLGHSMVAAASVATVMAATQLGSGLLWGFISERVSVRRATALMFVVQAVGLVVAMNTGGLMWLYVAFFLYGSGLGGAHVLQEVMWANYFGRISLGTVRGLSLPILLLCAAIGAPFFGYLYDYTGNYDLSLVLFIAVQVICAGVTLLVRRPVKPDWAPAVS